MNKEYWLQKLKISRDAKVLFYQNPKFFKGNTFRKEYLTLKFGNYEAKPKKKIYTITAICNSHHKHKGKREKVALVTAGK